MLWRGITAVGFFSVLCIGCIKPFDGPSVEPVDPSEPGESGSQDLGEPREPGSEDPNPPAEPELIDEALLDPNNSGDYSWVVVVDRSATENQAGMAGADICSIVADCPAGRLLPREGGVTYGSGLVCGADSLLEEQPICNDQPDRADPVAFLDRLDTCELDTSPSDFTSTGVGGDVAVDLHADLRGCTITVVEHLGQENEPYSVHICKWGGIDPGGCLLGGEPVAVSGPAGGIVQGEVPE